MRIPFNAVSRHDRPDARQMLEASVVEFQVGDRVVYRGSCGNGPPRAGEIVGKGVMDYGYAEGETVYDVCLDDTGEEKLLGLLWAGDPRGDVTTAWHAKRRSATSTPTTTPTSPPSGWTS